MLRILTQNRSIQSALDQIIRRYREFFGRIIWSKCKEKCKIFVKGVDEKIDMSELISRAHTDHASAQFENNLSNLETIAAYVMEHNGAMMKVYTEQQQQQQ